MKRLVVSLAVVTAAEIYAFYIFRSHPISRPAYFPALVTAIQFWMCYGGIESARWLLRRSPAARAPGPLSDWARLWIWVGPFGGLLMVLSSLLGWLASCFTNSWLPPAILLGHAAGGGMLWLLSSLEGVRHFATLDSASRRFNGGLAGLGLLTHLVGIYCYARFYPAGQLQVGLLFGAILLTYFVFYYLWLSCLAWAVVFRFWSPPRELDGSQG